MEIVDRDVIFTVAEKFDQHPKADHNSQNEGLRSMLN